METPGFRLSPDSCRRIVRGAVARAWRAVTRSEVDRFWTVSDGWAGTDDEVRATREILGAWCRICGESLLLRSGSLPRPGSSARSIALRSWWSVRCGCLVA